MTHLTTEQKARIYDDAVEELRHRMNEIDMSAEGASFYQEGRKRGRFFAYREALDLLTAPDVVVYVQRTSMSEKAKNFYMGVGIVTTMLVALWGIIGLSYLIFNICQQ